MCLPVWHLYSSTSFRQDTRCCCSFSRSPRIPEVQLSKINLRANLFCSSRVSTVQKSNANKRWGNLGVFVTVLLCKLPSSSEWTAGCHFMLVSKTPTNNSFKNPNQQQFLFAFPYGKRLLFQSNQHKYRFASYMLTNAYNAEGKICYTGQYRFHN